MKLLFVLLILIGCSSDEGKGKTEAEKLFNEATKLVKAERYILATEKLNLIKTQHPYSFYATPAELMLAEVQFKQENYIESAASFLLFRDFHPKHERIAWVIFMIGESYYKQLPATIDRDLESGAEALKYYDELINKYPQDANVAESQKRTNEIMGMLRQKDQYIADFYFRTKVWQASRWWYQDILERYKKGDPVPEHAMVRMVAASCQMKKWDDCLTLAEKFTPLVDKKGQEEIRSWEINCKKRETR
jgi:outer membrane protein assembly factor BamD